MPQIDDRDEFDLFLAQSLAPPNRVPDQQFLDRVSHQLALDKLRRRARANMVERLGVELLSILAVGGGLVAVGAGTNIADSAGNTPVAALVAMLILFAGWVTVVSRKERVRVHR